MRLGRLFLIEVFSIVQGTQNWIVGACMVDYRPRQLQRQKYLVAPVAEPVEATDLDSKG